MCAAKFFKGGELKNKLVIDQKATKIGKVEDTVITEDGKLGLLVKHDKTENIILYDQVKKIDDVVLLNIEYNQEVIETSEKTVHEQKFEEESIEKQIEELIEEPKEEIPEEPIEKPEEKVSMNICNSCGQVNKTGMKFCTHCGNSLT
jgi:sporulation protein YlmC with PRC-barrel domain